ncbi:MAG: LPS assembly lipoprotein LptE [Aureliella sp.]
MSLAIRRMLVLSVGLLFAVAGCAGYQFGSASLYNPNIRTIYIPIVRNETFRPDLGVQLTEALQREVELQTPFKVVANPSADSTLTCRVTAQTKRVIVEANTDEARAIENMISVELSWTDRQGNLLMENRYVPQGELAFFFIQGSDYVPEAGQSVATSQLRAVEQLAQQIVNQMEVRW